MAIHIKEVLPVLETISKQQIAISDRLAQLLEVFSREPAPVEPVLEAMLKPIKTDITEMKQTLTP